ncbi:TRIC cation channel family protein [Tessaracoccus sp. OS52]|uniref:trimeric intracellular cation channel family protein n=1 Tax=Tessaracoccus sp. OS52 TaxID=2886691 RepID=UPI001D10AAB5|nr:TRIC cation channel family protein [Tessaracoccus sp. OS52]MCC2593098.1 TRIC cation channel family protein [Tessaracoccus sp. OS52]
MEPWTPDVLFRVVDVAGVVGNGLLGGALARSQRYDLIGFLFLAVTSGLGGGIIRDLLLGTRFPVALTDPFYLGGAILAALVAYVVTLDGPISRRTLSLIDLLALGCWAATGASKALSVGLGWIPAILLGVITAVGGGMLRDVLVNRVPQIFGGNPLYATFAILAAAEMVVLQDAGHYEIGMAVAIASAAVLGGIARWRNWKLPDAPSVNIGGSGTARGRHGRKNDD